MYYYLSININNKYVFALKCVLCSPGRIDLIFATISNAHIMCKVYAFYIVAQYGNVHGERRWDLAAFQCSMHSYFIQHVILLALHRVKSN